LRGTLAVDGKAVCGSATGGESAIHMVSAFATELGVVLGQEKVAAKSNEITAIPELLDALYLKAFHYTQLELHKLTPRSPSLIFLVSRANGYTPCFRIVISMRRWR
jgi:hypothetical protein